VSLVDCLHCCIIPSTHKAIFEKIVPAELSDRVIYVDHDCKDVWEWSEKVYGIVKNMRQKNFNWLDLVTS